MLVAAGSEMRPAFLDDREILALAGIHRGRAASRADAAWRPAALALTEKSQAERSGPRVLLPGGGPRLVELGEMPHPERPPP